MARTQVFNLSCDFTESGESGFSTTYCGYPNTFLNHMISVGEIEETDRKIILTQFLRLNRSGRKMDESHMKKVEQMLSTEK